MNNPLVTVLITSYNPNPSYINATLKSVDMQSYSPLEILLVDDGSKNSVIDMITKPKNHNFSYIQMSHRGLPHGLIEGMKEAKGKYVAILDHDDLLTEDSVSSRVEALEKNPNAAISYGDLIYIDSEGKEYGRNLFKSYDDTYKFMKDILLNPLGPIQHTSIMFRKEHVDAVGNYNSDLKSYFDTDLVLRLADKYPVVHIDKPVVEYRTHSSNTSRSVTFKLKSINCKLDAVDTFLKSDMNNIDYKARVVFWSVMKAIYVNFSFARSKSILKYLK